jgi:hypothetical protein
MSWGWKPKEMLPIPMLASTCRWAGRIWQGKPDSLWSTNSFLLKMAHWELIYPAIKWWFPIIMVVYQSVSELYCGLNKTGNFWPQDPHWRLASGHAEAGRAWLGSPGGNAPGL